MSASDSGSIGCRVIHTVSIGAARQPVHRDGCRPAEFRHREVGQAKVQQRVVVQNCASGQICEPTKAVGAGQFEIENPVRIGHRIVGTQRHRQADGLHPVGEREVGADPRIVNAVDRRAIAGDQPPMHAVGQPASAQEGHHQRPAIFRHRKVVGAESERARIRGVTTIQTHQPRPRHAIEVLELAAQHNPAIVELHQCRLDVTIGPGPKVNVGIQCPVRIQSCHPAPQR